MCVKLLTFGLFSSRYLCHLLSTIHTRSPAFRSQEMAELALVDTASITNLLEGAGAPIIPTGKVSLHGGNVFTDKSKARYVSTLC